MMSSRGGFSKRALTGSVVAPSFTGMYRRADGHNEGLYRPFYPIVGKHQAVVAKHLPVGWCADLGPFGIGPVAVLFSPIETTVWLFVCSESNIAQA